MSLFQSRLIALFFVIPFFMLNNAQARSFKNAYISFEIQDNWKCKTEQSEWVCRSEDPQESKEAVIILTAKEAGIPDTFVAYNEHLSKPILLNLKTGGTMMSTITIPPREYAVGDQKWLDALHSNSEVQNYYTRYLATIKDKIAILVTFSAHSKFYAKHSAHFMKTIQSLKVIAAKDLTSRPESGPIRGSNEMLGPAIGQAMPADLLTSEDGTDSSTSASRKKGLLSNNLFLGFIFVILAIIGYVGFKFYKSRDN
jgi:hypothetical protein